jgi:hypothetical protein
LCEGAPIYHAHTVDTLDDKTEARMAGLGAMKQPTQRQGYSRVHISWNKAFFKILKKPSIVQNKKLPHMKAFSLFIDKKQKTIFF